MPAAKTITRPTAGDKTYLVAPTPAANMVSVYNGQDCLGHILNRDKVSFAAYTYLDELVGIFPTQKAAADALSGKVIA